ncbi:glycosyltransferase family 2 protein [Candidatus Riflebacteria bacterium]
MKTFCVMPVYNEAARLRELLEQYRECMPADFLYIVDNGSTDGSSQVIQNSKFDYIQLDKNYGVGYALKLGAQKALEMGFDIYAGIAGNGKMLPAQMHRLLQPIKEGKADYVTGSRFLEGGDSPNLPLFRKISIPLVVNNLIYLLYGKKLTDATNGYRAYRVEILKDKRIDWQASWLHSYQFEYYIYAKILKLGYHCLEVPTSMVYPPPGKKYSHIPPFIGWWQMLEPWILVGLGLK